MEVFSLELFEEREVPEGLVGSNTPRCEDALAALLLFQDSSTFSITKNINRAYKSPDDALSQPSCDKHITSVPAAQPNHVLRTLFAKFPPGNSPNPNIHVTPLPPASLPVTSPSPHHTPQSLSQPSPSTPQTPSPTQTPSSQTHPETPPPQ